MALAHDVGSPIVVITPATDEYQVLPRGSMADDRRHLKAAYETAREGDGSAVYLEDGRSVIVIPEHWDRTPNYYRLLTGLNVNVTEDSTPSEVLYEDARSRLWHEGGHVYLVRRYDDHSEYGADTFLQKSGAEDNRNLLRHGGPARLVEGRALSLFFLDKGGGRMPLSNGSVLSWGNYVGDRKKHEWGGMLRPSDRIPELNRDEEFRTGADGIFLKGAKRMFHDGKTRLTPDDETAINDALSQDVNGQVTIHLTNMPSFIVQANGKLDPAVIDEVKAVVAFNRERQKASTRIGKSPFVEPNSQFAKDVVSTVAALYEDGASEEPDKRAGGFTLPDERVFAQRFSKGAEDYGEGRLKGNR
jgi:hypothetical protein